MSNGGLSSDTQAMMAFQSQKKSTGVAFLFWLFTGGIGGHRFYLGRIGSAVGQLALSAVGWLTLVFGVGLFFLGALGVWLLVDAFLISGMVAKHNADLMGRLDAAARPAHSPVEELAKFAALKNQGAISDEEFEQQKRRLIGAAPAKDATA